MKPGGFPRRITWSNWGQLMCDARLFAPLAKMACARHGLSFGEIRPGFPGTCAVFEVVSGRSIGSFYVKFFPPVARGDFPRELAVLRLLERREALGGPKLLGHGVVKKSGIWPYLVVTAVEGRALRDAWPLIPDKDRSRIARQAGKWLYMFNRIRVPRREAVAAGFRPWAEFLMGRKRRFCVELRRAGFTRLSFLKEAERRIRGVRPVGRPVLVNGDLTEDHVMVSRGRGGWGISGIIDFADSLIGDSSYELAPVWLGTLGRDPVLMKSFLQGFSPGRTVTSSWRDRAAAFTVIHLFGSRMIATTLGKDRLDPGKFESWAEFRDWLWPESLDQRGTKRK